jgi:hypothetical protein
MPRVQRNILMVVIGLLSLWLLLPVAESVTYWVSSSLGSNANACNAVDGMSDPDVYKQTINGDLTCLRSGDTLIIKAGTYTEAIGTTGVPNGTSESNRTTIKAEINGTVTLRPRGPLRVIELSTST